MTARVLAAVEARLAYRPPPRTRRILLVAAVLIFLVGGLVSLRTLRVDLDQLRWIPLLASAVVGVPLAALGGALEYRVMARESGVEVELGEALRVAVVGSAANLLPLPGSVLVRLKAVVGSGGSLARSTLMTAVTGFTWIAVALGLAGVFLLTGGRTGLGVLFLAATLVPGSALLLLRWGSGREAHGRRAGGVLAVEAYTVGVAALRTWLVLAGLGAPASWTAAFLFPVAGSLASAVGFLPGGMGLRELLSAGLLPLGGVSAALGFLVSAVHRVLGSLTYAPIAALLLAGEGDDPQPPASTSSLHSGSSP